jgi:hypothetical protein
MAGLKLRHILVTSVVLAVAVVAAAPCSATSITANAGSTLATAQDLTSAGPTEIFGSLNGDPNDVAFFKIYLFQPTLFSAMTVDSGAFGIPDTVLALFDMNGNGIYLNDDISGGNTLSCISVIAGAGNPCPTNGSVPLAMGDYYLALSESANYPVDASDNELFAPIFSTDLATVVSGVGPVAGYDGNSFTSPDTDNVNYDIVLTGAAPEAGTWFMMASGMALLVAGNWRRRQAIGSTPGR